MKQINRLAASSERWDILLVFWRVLPFSLSLSPFTFNFLIDVRTVCLCLCEWFLVLMLLSYLIFLFLQAKKKKKCNLACCLFSLLTRSLSRDIHMSQKRPSRKNDHLGGQGHIYTSNLLRHAYFTAWPLTWLLSHISNYKPSSSSRHQWM